MTNTTKQSSTILVLGSTGKIGRRITERLRDADHQVLAASRSGETRFDWNDRSTWGPALAGTAVLYLLVPDEGTTPIAQFVQQAVDSGVRRIVAQSGRRVEQLGETKAIETERAVRDSGVEWTLVQPNLFCQNFDEGFFNYELSTGSLSLPTGDTVEPFVDADDVADVAVAALTQDGHAGRAYELTGPRAIGFAEAVEIIARVSGRPMVYQDVPAQAFVDALRAFGLDDDLVGMLDTLFAGVRAGTIADPADGVQQVLGREPVSFETYAAKAAAAGAWS